MSKITSTFFLDRILLFIVFFFPLIIVLRSTAINIAIAIVSIIVFFFYFNKKQKNFLRNKLVIYIFILCLFIFINSIIHFTSFDLVLKSLGNIRYLLLSIGIYLALEKMSHRQLNFFICFNIIIISLIAVDIFYQFFFYKDFLGFTPGMCSEVLPIKCQRFSGVFGDELIAGSYLSQIGFLILTLFFNLNKTYLNFIIKTLFCLFLLATVLLTGERAPLLIIIFALFFIFLFKKRIVNFFVILIFLLILIFFSAQKIESINSRYIKLFDGWGPISKQTSVVSKIIESPWSFHYQAAVELFLEKPVLGHGFKSFRIKCENTNIDKKVREQREYYRDYRACSTHPHNYLLEFLSENGIVGGIFFIGFFFIIFISVYKKCQNNKDKNLLALIGIGSLILGIIFPLKPSGSFFSTFNASMLFYILGFFLYYIKKVK
jgi:O-antigen ligase